jgi:hypothetical protein
MKCKLKINLDEYEIHDEDYEEWGTITTINGEILHCRNSDTGMIVKQILEHLGYDVEVTISENGEEVAVC